MLRDELGIIVSINFGHLCGVVDVVGLFFCFCFFNCVLKNYFSRQDIDSHRPRSLKVKVALFD